MTVLDYIRKRREEAIEKYHRFIHPDPIFSDLRKQFIKVSNEGNRLLLVKGVCDVVEGTLRELRTVEFWSSLLSSIIANRVIRPLIETALDHIFPRGREK